MRHFAIMLGVMTVFLCVEARAESQCPEEHEGIKSNSHYPYQSVKLTVHNIGLRKLRFYRLNHEGMRNQYRSSLSPGGASTSDAHVGDIWVITDEKDNCVKLFNIETDISVDID